MTLVAKVAVQRILKKKKDQVHPKINLVLNETFDRRTEFANS